VGNANYSGWLECGAMVGLLRNARPWNYLVLGAIVIEGLIKN